MGRASGASKPHRTLHAQHSARVTAHPARCTTRCWPAGGFPLFRSSVPPSRRWRRSSVSPCRNRGGAVQPCSGGVPHRRSRGRGSRAPDRRDRDAVLSGNASTCPRGGTTSRNDAYESSDSDQGLVRISAGWVRPDGAGSLDRDERRRQLVDLPGEASALENGDGAARDPMSEELGTTPLDDRVAAIVRSLSTVTPP
jgi:hypothetical protein